MSWIQMTRTPVAGQEDNTRTPGTLANPLYKYYKQTMTTTGQGLWIFLPDCTNLGTGVTISFVGTGSAYVLCSDDCPYTIQTGTPQTYSWSPGTIAVTTTAALVNMVAIALTVVTVGTSVTMTVCC